ncbi:MULTISPECIES: FusB/FusC family EF-G-binding protein [Paenibacillus]|uniref:FusB/FusC family EF-G-binding protein n=1 Tax=Paenibacillus TaxID=44249 RepID=UPI0022B8FA93|nr:FusB/FusC family EF-G-binding protein [Paenibacillus caseinilyticus]MCZ8520310.1 FusB/FusC family EF-G-binding protein [Paenibacillus caseinilyticus]
MSAPFIRNHHYNWIKKQIGHLQHACQSVSDPRVVESVRGSTESRILELLPDTADGLQHPLAGISALRKSEDFQLYLRSVESYMTEFPQITEKQIRKLFPKAKKLPMPDLAVDFRYLTYLGWVDISSNKLFIVYPLNGQLAGIEGRYTPTNKKGICFLCGKHGESALYTAVSKARPAHASSDYYKAVGNYMCLDSRECNKNITDVAPLERFCHEVLG